MQVANLYKSALSMLGNQGLISQADQSDIADKKTKIFLKFILASKWKSIRNKENKLPDRHFSLFVAASWTELLRQSSFFPHAYMLLDVHCISPIGGRRRSSNFSAQRRFRLLLKVVYFNQGSHEFPSLNSSIHLYCPSKCLSFPE